MKQKLQEPQILQEMIKSNFYKVFDVAVTHTYFLDTICKGLLYTASEETTHIMKRFSLKLKHTRNGFELYSDAKTSLKHLLNYITTTTGEKAFKFNVITQEPYFYQFTNLPINQIGILEYTSSLVSSVTTFGTIILQPRFVPTEEADKLFGLTVKFEDLISSDANGEIARYQINFEARATKWEYYIINNSHQNLGELSIKSNTDITFGGPNTVRLQNGETAQLFSLENQLLALSEIPQYHFNLISSTEKNGTTRAKTVFKGLPNPNPNVLQVNTKVSPPLVVSLMYVYV